jgi:hypothetical protein
MMLKNHTAYSLVFSGLRLGIPLCVYTYVIEAFPTTRKEQEKKERNRHYYIALYDHSFIDVIDRYECRHGLNTSEHALQSSHGLQTRLQCTNQYGIFAFRKSGGKIYPVRFPNDAKIYTIRQDPYPLFETDMLIVSFHPMDERKTYFWTSAFSPDTIANDLECLRGFFDQEQDELFRWIRAIPFFWKYESKQLCRTIFANLAGVSSSATTRTCTPSFHEATYQRVQNAYKEADMPSYCRSQSFDTDMVYYHPLFLLYIPPGRRTKAQYELVHTRHPDIFVHESVLEFIPREWWSDQMAATVLSRSSQRKNHTLVRYIPRHILRKPSIWSDAIDNVETDLYELSTLLCDPSFDSPLHISRKTRTDNEDEHEGKEDKEEGGLHILCHLLKKYYDECRREVEHPSSITTMFSLRKVNEDVWPRKVFNYIFRNKDETIEKRHVLIQLLTAYPYLLTDWKMLDNIQKVYSREAIQAMLYEVLKIHPEMIGEFALSLWTRDYVHSKMVFHAMFWTCSGEEWKVWKELPAQYRQRPEMVSTMMMQDGGDRLLKCFLRGELQSPRRLDIDDYDWTKQKQVFYIASRIAVQKNGAFSKDHLPFSWRMKMACENFIYGPIDTDPGPE